MTVDLSWRGVFKSGGFSLMAGGVILIVFILSVFIFRVDLPLTSQAVLENPMPPITLYLIAALGELLLLPGALGLYLSLKDVSKNHMLIAAAFWLVAVSMYFVSRGQILSLLPISNQYMVISSELTRTAYLVSADRALEVANIYGNMALMLHQVGAIVMGLVMLKGVYGRRTGYLVTVAGTMTFIGTFGILLRPLALFTLFGLMLTGVWQIIVGAKLYKLGARGNSERQRNQVYNISDKNRIHTDTHFCKTDPSLVIHSSI
jgi:hypothetical protein